MEAAAASAALLRVTLVRGDVPGPELIELARNATRHLPIVDDADRFLGFVTPKLLDEARWPFHRVAVALAREVAAGASLLVLETEPLGRALRLMARRGARSVALVDPDGVLQGVLTDVDALWAATHGSEPPPSKTEP
jgi:CBS domain-containing protein